MRGGKRHGAHPTMTGGKTAGSASRLAGTASHIAQQDRIPVAAAHVDRKLILGEWIEAQGVRRFSILRLLKVFFGRIVAPVCIHFFDLGLGWL